MRRAEWRAARLLLGGLSAGYVLGRLLPPGWLIALLVLAFVATLVLDPTD